MIDYDHVAVTRGQFKDKASGSNFGLIDRVRTKWKLRNRSNIRYGHDVILKKAVDVRVCETGILTIGNQCKFDDYCMILLTMPKPVVTIGDWVRVNRNTVIASKNSISIGSYTIIAPYCYIIDHEHGFEKNDIMLNQQAVLKDVHIGRDCWLGTGVKVLAGSRIGDGAIIGAGSVVSSEIPPNQIWAGVPARYIRDR